MPHIKRLKEAAKAWAAQEAADIKSEAKKPPTSSLEKFMADKNKPLKTALVRETETKTSRSNLAQDFRAVRKAKLGISKESSQMHRLQSAAETGEAQAFVGRMKPGVSMRTQQHHLQSREFTKTKTGELEFGTKQKDLNRSVVNVVRQEADISGSQGTLRKLAQKRAAEGRAVAGQPGNLEGSRQSLSNALRKNNPPKGKGRRGGGGAPDFVAEDFGSHSSSSQNRAWDAVAADIKKNLKID